MLFSMSFVASLTLRVRPLLPLSWLLLFRSLFYQLLHSLEKFVLGSPRTLCVGSVSLGGCSWAEKAKRCKWELF